MRQRFHLAAGTAIVLLIFSGGSASAQYRDGTPVDRNVGDTGPNAASQRVAQPGIGQFGVGSLLLDRYASDPSQPERFQRNANDPRVNQRYLMQTPGVTALIDRPEYIGPSPIGGWVRNGQTFDGAEILTLTPANLVFVLSPELLQPKRTPVRPIYEPNPNDHPNRIQPRTQSDPYAIMRSSELSQDSFTVNRDAYTPPQRVAPEAHNNYRHPAIIERQRKLREERERERIVAEGKEDAPNDDQHDRQQNEQPEKNTG